MKHGSTVGRNNQRALRRMYCFKPMGEFRVEEQGQALHLTLIAQHSNGVIQKVTEGCVPRTQNESSVELH